MLRWHLLMSVMCYLWGPHCLIEPMIYSHVAIGIVYSIEVCCCCVAMWHWVLRWLCHGLPRGMLVGPTCQISIVVGLTWLRWTNDVLPRGTLFLPLILYEHVCLGPPVCTQKCFYPQVIPREVLIKS
jgi:hypothetical protein